MGMDVYVGPLRRYFARDWLTAAQQADAAAGLSVTATRAPAGRLAGRPADESTPSPAQVEEAVMAWQASLLASLGRDDAWPEDPALPYWTDKPGWDGFGALVLLAAYDECPELRPAKRGLLRRAATPDGPRNYASAPAVREAAKNPRRYPSLLLGTEWWLPLPGAPSLFSGRLPTGQETVLSTVEQLRTELGTLATNLGLDAAGLASLRHAGPPLQAPRDEDQLAPAPDVDALGRSGLAMLSALAERAGHSHQPLVLDY